MEWTAERVKKRVWINSPKCAGDDLTINRLYLSYLLEKLEKCQYNNGYHDGYDDGINVSRDELEIDKNFEGTKAEW